MPGPMNYMMEKTAIAVAGRRCGALAVETAGLLGMPFLQAYSRRFPDGEIYVRAPLTSRAKAVVLFVCMGNRPSEGLLETLLLVDALRRQGAEKIVLVAPYMPYARQDSIFKTGEPLSIKAVARLLEDSGIAGIVTVDMHLHRFKSIEEVFSIPAVNVSAVPLLAKYVAEKYGSLAVVAPDEEAEQWAVPAARILGTRYYVLTKERSGDEEVEVSGLGEAPERALVIDDIISTGGTIARTASLLRKMGAKDIVVACTHALLVGDAEAKIFNNGVRELISTNTVPNPYARVSVARAIAEGVGRVIGDDS